ncbi:palladin isoform X2 [Synchiropus splendidus]|uniref:palladin isoform X2 n=1 Tax=Synchiropus splendidus TaxID=270530 RepID=UPI00237D9DCC|nr:palladin isoform X2 [Synchiropus splendidus]
MAHIQKVQQKKTSTMSLTISSSSTASASREFSSSKSSASSSSSLIAQRHSSLVQPLCVSPQSMQSPLCHQQYAGNGAAPSFVKCLHDMTTAKGQLVVLECRLRGTPPLQVMWYREDEQIVDSDDFRILRKKTNSGTAPEELCTLVITEAFPEDSGLFKCMALNSFGTVSCSAMLEVFDDLEEQHHVTAVRHQDLYSVRQEKEALTVQESSSIHPSPEEFPTFSPDSTTIASPEWPDNPPEEDISNFDLPDPHLDNHLPAGYFGGSEEVHTGTPSPPPPPSVEIQQRTNQTAKLFTPSKLNFSSSHSGSNNMNLSDLPTFTPSAFPPSAFNYERPRHFIQSQAAFQAPSYESVMRDAQENQSNSEVMVNSDQETSSVMDTKDLSKMTMSKQCRSVSASVTQTQSQFQSLNLNQHQTHIQANGMSKSSPSSSSVSSPISTPASSAAPPSFALPLTSSSTVTLASTPRTTMRSTITLNPSPSIPSAMGLGSATLPANQDTMSAPAAYLCSVLPSQSPFPLYNKPGPTHHNSNTSLLGPSSPLLPTRALSSPSSFPKPLPVSPTLPRSPVSPAPPSPLPEPNIANSPNRVPPAVVSLPANLKGTPSILPKPILKKSVAPRPSSSRSTEEEIQGSKDALIQDLEKKLRSKEARRRSGQDCAVGRHTGGLWGRHHSGVDERGNEGADIQEKCYAPRFLQVPPDLTVEEGRFCRIDFKVGGLPAPDVCWYLDNKAIRPDDYHKMLVCEKGMHSFLIEIVTVHHAGVYECVARNRAGEARFTMRLDVIAQEALRPPTFVQKMSNSRVLEGDTVRLECQVDASPPPQLFWKKDKDMLRIDPHRMSLYQDGSGHQCLLIERVTKSDAGWYTLSAINEAGMSTCNARLDISSRAAPVMKTAPPGSKSLKLLSANRVSDPTESSAHHTAPLYESEEL